MIEKTLYLSFTHGGKEWTYPGIVYARGGDTISGGIHEELAETEDLSPIEAVEVAFEEESAGIAKLADAFGRVFVPDCGGGNHDRITKKPRSKKAHANFDRLINYMLRRQFQNDPRVTFQNTLSMDVLFTIYGRNILLTHGDRIGSRGGQGFIGPAATILRGAQKVIMEQSALGRHIDMVMMGHFHTPMYLGWVMVNGSLPGYSEFAKMNRMRPFPPQQMLSFWHPDRGCVDLKPMILTEA
jgi:predicted phosphodiesterase